MENYQNIPYDEDFQAFLNGEVHHNCPYNQDEDATYFWTWNDGYSAAEERYTPNIQMRIR
jgi:ribosome modulation factor